MTYREFRPEPNPGLFHPDATSSFKQVQFGEANQLTFHEKDIKKIDGVDCIKVEPDIDYFQDLGAHTLLEVIPHSITHGLTDPKKVYVLRWIAGRHAGVPEFAPPHDCRLGQPMRKGSYNTLKTLILGLLHKTTGRVQHFGKSNFRNKTTLPSIILIKQ